MSANRFKRVVREAFRELYPSLPTDLELNISPQKNHPELTMMAILTDLKNLLSKTKKKKNLTTILETAVGDGKLTQYFDQNRFRLGTHIPIRWNGAPIANDSESKSCITLPSRTAVSRFIQLSFG